MSNQTFIDSLKSTKDIVRWLLYNNPKLRSNDKRLILNVWAIERPDIRNKSFKNFADLFTAGKISTPETIRRCRQKIQEQEEDLRGVNYKGRQQTAKHTQQNIKFL